MSGTAAVSALAPFRVRSFRFQWPADLSTSWAFEMETLILGWYVLVETGSVFLLAVFASLQYIGTLISPFVGVMADRFGIGNVLSGMRAIYATLAGVLMTFALLDALTPLHVFVIASFTGIVRPSDMGMRAALVGDTMPADRLVGAMAIERTTMDSARVAGALTGAGLVAALGIGPAYVCVTVFYAAAFVLTLKVARIRVARHGEIKHAAAHAPWRELKAAAAYVWHTPLLLGTLCLAFLVNLTAYPLTGGLLAYVARDIYGTGQTGLGYLVAGFAGGALIGSVFLGRLGGRIHAARTMLIFCAMWYVMLLVFAQVEHHVLGVAALVAVGCMQSLGMVPMSALLLRNSDVQYRGRLMGLRMLAIYGLPVGLLIAGPLITAIGFRTTASLYAVIGFLFVGVIAYAWRESLWRLDAPGNRR